MEMTKWFDTNYHYIVPEIGENQVYRFASTKVVDEFLEAKDAGIQTRPVLLGPVSYLLLSKASSPQTAPLDTLPGLVGVYVQVLERLAAVGADWVQMDEPCLVLDLDETARAAFTKAYSHLSQVAGIRLMAATYFGSLEDNLSLAVQLPVDRPAYRSSSWAAAARKCLSPAAVRKNFIPGCDQWPQCLADGPGYSLCANSTGCLGFQDRSDPNRAKLLADVQPTRLRT